MGNPLGPPQPTGTPSPAVINAPEGLVPHGIAPTQPPSLHQGTNVSPETMDDISAGAYPNPAASSVYLSSGAQQASYMIPQC